MSNGLNVFTESTTILNKVAVGDSVTITGKISEFRSTGSGDLFGTEIEPSSTSDVVVGTKNNKVTPLVLGVDRSPPTQSLSALDVGSDGFLSVPNNQSLVESVNATLQPTEFGLDFWESLEGQLVTIKAPTVTDFENSFGEFWVYGDWPVTGLNSRGGITMTFGTCDLPRRYSILFSLKFVCVCRSKWRAGRKSRGRDRRTAPRRIDEPACGCGPEIRRHYGRRVPAVSTALANYRNRITLPV